MQWHFRNDQPIYAQLIDQITRAILSGTFAPGQRLPAVRELAAQAGVNPNTMQRAMAQLEGTGLIYSQRTAGRFVTQEAQVIAAAREELARQRLADFLRSMEELGYDNEQVRQLLMNAPEQEDMQ